MSQNRDMSKDDTSVVSKNAKATRVDWPRTIDGERGNACRDPPRVRASLPGRRREINTTSNPRRACIRRAVSRNLLPLTTSARDQSEPRQPLCLFHAVGWTWDFANLSAIRKQLLPRCVPRLRDRSYKRATKPRQKVSSANPG
jgi:hypothetical protein